MTHGENVLLQKARTVIERTGELEDQKNNMKILDMYKTRIKTMNEWRSKLQKRVLQQALFHQRGISIHLERQVVDSLSALLRQLQTGFAENGDFLQTPGILNSMSAKIESVVGTYDAIFQSAWQSYAAKNIPPISDAFLQAMETVGAFRADAQKVRSYKRQMDVLVTKVPNESSDFDRFEQLLFEINKAWEKLSVDQVPDGVVDFLRSAGEKDGADLDLYTQEVREWLLKMNIGSHFRIHISRSERGG